MLQVQRKGAETALTTCAVEMGTSLPTVLPYLWETIHTTLQQKVPDPGWFEIVNPVLFWKYFLCGRSGITAGDIGNQ